MLLIVGSGGLLGARATAHFRRLGSSVVRASHGPEAELPVDLMQPGGGDLIRRLPNGVTHALLAGSITSLDACARDPEATGRFNVTHTIQLLEALLARDIQPVFCSSDLVFAGDRGGYRETDPRQPTTEYGRHKHAVEEFLLGQDRPFLVIRMSKLYSLDADDPSPIGQMLTALLRGEAIRCADDQVICPTAVDDVPRALEVLLRQHATGVYHVAAPQRFTRYTLGRRVAAAVGREALVQRCSIRDFAFAEPRPVDNSLDSSRLIAETGFQFTTLQESLPEILRRRHAHAEVGS